MLFYILHLSSNIWNCHRFNFAVSAGPYSWWLPSLCILWLLIVKLMFLGFYLWESFEDWILLAFLWKGFVFVSASHQGTPAIPDHLYFNLPSGPPSAQVKAGTFPYCPFLCSIFISCSPLRYCNFMCSFLLAASPCMGPRLNHLFTTCHKAIKWETQGLRGSVETITWKPALNLTYFLL